MNERIEFYQQNKDKKPGLLNPKPKKSLNYHDNASGLTQLKTAKDWLKEVNSQALQQSLKHLDAAYQKFFKAGAGFSGFKSKRDKQSFKIPQHLNMVKNHKLAQAISDVSWGGLDSLNTKQLGMAEKSW